MRWGPLERCRGPVRSCLHSTDGIASVRPLTRGHATGVQAAHRAGEGRQPPPSTWPASQVNGSAEALTARSPEPRLITVGVTTVETAKETTI